MTDNTPTTKQEEGGLGAQWLTLSADEAHYVDFGRTVVLCDRLPRPVTLVIKNPVYRSGASFPPPGDDAFPASLADRVGTSATPPHNEDGLRKALENWRNNLAITQNSPVHGDVLHGPPLDFVIEALDSILARQALGDIPSG